MTYSSQDFERCAQQTMRPDLYDYFGLGACDNMTLARNRNVFNNIVITPRILRDTTNINVASTLLQADYAMPVLIAPMAFLKAAHADGEKAVANAAEMTNIGFILSTMATTKMEEIHQPLGKKWFQLYPFNDKTITAALIGRAAAAGYDAIVLTVDVPIMGNRVADKKNNFTLPPDLFAANLVDYYTGFDATSGSAIKHFADSHADRSFTWQDISWIKANVSLPVILKGIMHPLDVQLAIEHGVDGIIISNHGGRQLDTTPATMEVLPSIRAVAPATMPLLIDSGFRSGADIFKAIALGADAVLLGRPIIWALHAGGEAGVIQLIQTIKHELAATMILSGLTSITELKSQGKQCVAFAGSHAWQS